MSKNIKVGPDKRGYATKLDYQVTREALEKYVEERGCVPRERAIQDILQERGTMGYAMNTGQVGQLIKYSRSRGNLTSFTHNGQYYITTLDRMNEFTRGNWKQVNQTEREPEKRNFLTGIIERGRQRLAEKENKKLEEEIEELRREARKIRGISESSKPNEYKQKQGETNE